MNIFESKIFWTVALLSNIGNVIIGFKYYSIFAGLGWLVALLYFPYHRFKSSQIKLNQEKEK